MRDDTDCFWRDFPQTAHEFEERFASEEDCREYWIEARWGGVPVCPRCSSEQLWWRADGKTFECAECHHQSSLTAGTILERTRKPLKMWFRAMFEISVHKTGISAKDLQRIMGFGSYKTAWSWLHKLRALMKPAEDAEPLGPFLQMDEALLGGRGGPHKELVLVAAEPGARVRMVHAINNDTASIKSFADAFLAKDASVATDGLASYSPASLGKRRHEKHIQNKEERRENDAVQACHRMISLLKRWILGTHAGAVRAKHLQSYLDEFAFRHNRRKTRGIVRITARLMQRAASHPPLTMRDIIDKTLPYRFFTQKTGELQEARG